jgi:hypothetical protein
MGRIMFQVSIDLGKGKPERYVKLYFSVDHIATQQDIASKAVECLVIYDDKKPENVPVGKVINFSEYDSVGKRVKRGGIKGFMKKKEDQSFSVIFTNGFGTSYV